MPEIVQDPNGGFLIDADMVFEGVHMAAALIDRVPLKRFPDDSTYYISIDDAIDWWQKEDIKEGPLEALLTLKGKLDRCEIKYYS